MGRMDIVNARLSSVMGGEKRVVYFVTEDRDFLMELVRSITPTIKAMGSYYLKDKQWERNNYYDSMKMNGYLVDIYEMLQLSRIRFDADTQNQTAVQTNTQKAIFYYLTDYHTLKKSDLAGQLLKEFIAYSREREKQKKPVFLFLVSPVLQLPVGFEQDIEIIDVPEMTQEDIFELLERAAVREISGRELHPYELRRCREAAKDFKGIARKDILQIIRDIQDEHGSFFGQQDRHDSEMFAEIRKSRKEWISEYKKRAAKADRTVTLLEAYDAISGMDGYFGWLQENRRDFLDPEEASSWGILPPKGVLLTGVPGSGKTQAAKKTAYVLGENSDRVSLVQLRMENLLGRHVGESEANFMRCRKRVEALAPAVVLIDEIEKLFSQKTSDSSGVRTNLLAALLDWLQENKKQIFFFATSNSVEGLPPELLRDRRFDMRYYSFMPSHAELVTIIVFYLKNSHKMSGEKKRFSRFEKEYEDLANQFLDAITDYAISTHKDMFFTGSNIENLITQTNQGLRSKNVEKPNKKEYLDMMLEKAKSDGCQPYGETNMESIVSFWHHARRKKYASTSGKNILPFGAFDAKTGRFIAEKLGDADYAYDRYMQQRLCAEIEASVQRNRYRS